MERIQDKHAYIFLIYIAVVTPGRLFEDPPFRPTTLHFSARPPIVEKYKSSQPI